MNTLQIFSIIFGGIILFSQVIWPIIWKDMFIFFWLFRWNTWMQYKKYIYWKDDYIKRKKEWDKKVRAIVEGDGKFLKNV